jgi:subtilase family serine protease
VGAMQARTLGALAAAMAVLLAPQLVAVHNPAHAGPAPASGLVTDAVDVPTGSHVEALSGGQTVDLAFVLGFANASRLVSLDQALQDPQSPLYRHFLSVGEFDHEFAPSAGSVATVVRAIEAGGGSSVSVAPGRLAVSATFSVAAAERMLSVAMVGFSGGDGPDGYTSVGTVVLPGALQGRVVGIDGLSSSRSVVGAFPTLRAVSPLTPVPSGGTQFVQGNGSDKADWYIGTDYTQAYAATSLLPGGATSVPNATYPTDVAVATLLFSAYNNTTETTLPPWDPAVVDAYFNDTFPAGWPMPTLTGVAVPIAGAGAPPPPGPLGNLSDSIGSSVENSLDLEMAGSLAPGAALYNFYFNGSLLVNPATTAGATTYFADDLGAALNYSHYGTAHLGVVSCSFGVPDTNNSQWDADLTEAATLGVTIVAASGDQGNAPTALTGRPDPVWPLWPATAAFNTSGAISVGGVSVQLSGSPTSDFSSPPLALRYDANDAGISTVTAWWQQSVDGSGDAGTEGGTSVVYPEPYWQFHSAAQPPIVNASITEGVSVLGRAGPDVAFPANATIAYVALVNTTPQFEVLEGTSIAAPVFAGLLADIVAVESYGHSGATGLGFLDPELYRIASYFAAHPATGGAAGNDAPFRDVTSGHNALFQATPGWDPLTGWGGISAPLFLEADRNQSVADYTYTGPTPTIPTGGHAPSSILTLVIIVGGAAAVVTVAYLVFSSRSRPPTPNLRAVPAYGPAPGSAVGVSPPTVRSSATFACPYCGIERPAEAGHCPGCGAM